MPERNEIQISGVAEKAVLKTLGLEHGESLENFFEKFKTAVKSLEQYKKLKTEMDAVLEKDLPLAIFKEIQQTNDLELEESADVIPTDGVLISSIKQGHIECAGRTFIASIYLQDRNIPHAVVEVPSHSMLLMELNNDSLAYLDANHNLFFSFPKAALKGYSGPNEVSECRLEDFQSRPQDVHDGFDLVYKYFIALPAKEGVQRQYLGSVKAALAGNPEFEHGNIEMNLEAADQIDEIEQRIVGKKDPRLIAYFDSDAQMAAEREGLEKEIQKAIFGIFESSQNREGFFKGFMEFLKTDGGAVFPYLRNADSISIRAQSDIIFTHFSGERN